jgi:hypothetical protein
VDTGAGLSPAPRWGIIRSFPGTAIMEAERANAIANTITDLTQRVADLRRYL